MARPYLYHIVAISGKDRVIGNNNQLPWPKYSEDLKFFKAMTTGHTVLMGRKTFESIGRPLPNRINFVLSRSKDFEVPEGVRVFHSFEEAIKNAKTEKVFIIGGAEIYRQTINSVDGIYRTKVPGDYEGDAHYPEIPLLFETDVKESEALKQKYGINVQYLKNQNQL